MNLKIKNNKVYNDNNEVAILYSPGYGAGWFTWNENFPECITDADIVMAIINNDKSRAAEIATSKFGSDFCTLGVRDLKVSWIKEGSAIIIDEYDGYESIKFADNQIILV